MQMISNKVYLAMNAAFFIAYNGNDDLPVAGSAIVEYSNLNKRALEPVLQRLSNADIIVSVKGAKGGYFMGHPEKTTLRHVAEAFIERIVPEKHEFLGYDAVLDVVLTDGYDEWLENLSQTTFKDLCTRARNSGKMPVQENPILNFAI